MARMHRRRKGRSGSTRPHLEKPPEWVSASPKEVEQLVVEFHQQGLQTAEIGVRLRDQHGIPSVKLVTGKSITRILEDHGVTLEMPEDLQNLLAKAVRLSSHLADNPKDVHNRRNLELLEAKVRRLAKYYKREGVLPSDWTYTRTTTEMRLR